MLGLSKGENELSFWIKYLFVLVGVSLCWGFVFVVVASTKFANWINEWLFVSWLLFIFFLSFTAIILVGERIKIAVLRGLDNDE